MPAANKRRLTLPKESGAGELSRPLKRWRTVAKAMKEERCLRDFINRGETDIFSFRQMLTVRIVSTVRTVVSEELNKALKALNAVHRPIIPIQQNNNWMIQLKFLDKVNQPVYTAPFKVERQNGDKINTGLRIGICLNDVIITSGPLSSVEIKVLVLHGDFRAENGWIEEDLSRSIVMKRENKPPLLMENHVVKLKNGEACIDWLVFGDNSSWTRAKMFRLGIRVLNWRGETVQSGITEPFSVLDRRMEGRKKHHPPLLSDPVWRLEEIAKGGDRCKSLENHGIFVVKDLLIFNHKNEPALRNILGVSESSRTWRTIIEHAKCADMENFYDVPITQNQHFPQMGHDALAINNPLIRDRTCHHGSGSSQQHPLENQILNQYTTDVFSGDISGQQFPYFDDTNTVYGFQNMDPICPVIHSLLGLEFPISDEPPSIQPNFPVQSETLICEPSNEPRIPSRTNSFNPAECPDLVRDFISANLQNLVHDEIQRNLSPVLPRNWLKIKALVRFIAKPLLSSRARTQHLAQGTLIPTV